MVAWNGPMPNKQSVERFSSHISVEGMISFAYNRRFRKALNYHAVVAYKTSTMKGIVWLNFYDGSVRKLLAYNSKLTLVVANQLWWFKSDLHHLGSLSVLHDAYADCALWLRLKSASLSTKFDVRKACQRNQAERETWYLPIHKKLVDNDHHAAYTWCCR